MMGSMAYMTGPAGRPLRAGSSVIDIGAATYGVLATLAALVDRQRTGRGQRIQSGLFESTVWFVAQHLAQASLNGESPVPMPERGMGSRLGWGIYRLFKTADDRQVSSRSPAMATGSVSARNSDWKTWPPIRILIATPSGLRTAIHHPADRSRCCQPDRGRADRADGAGPVPYAPLNNPFDLLSDPQLNSGKLMEVQTEAGPTIKTAGAPVASNNFMLSVRHQPPGLGQHTREVLLEIGQPARD